MKKKTIKQITDNLIEHRRDDLLEGLLVKYSTLAFKYSSREIPLTEFDQGKASVMRQIKNLFK